MIEIKFDKENNRAIAINNNIIIGKCDFVIMKNCWNIVHTVVADSNRGQGIARKLVECILEKAKEQRVNVIATCSYAKRVIEDK